ncbi:MAG: adenylate/guanylate cyclase domain-containing protein [Corynebacterium sp.]|nr:adenylate/guanylate cyclase domain-containing protein [Corynebacterium sp.]
MTSVPRRPHISVWARYAISVITTNLLAFVGLLLFLHFLIPMPLFDSLPLVSPTLYFLGFLAIGLWISWLIIRPVAQWQREKNSTDIWSHIIYIPIYQALICLLGWLSAAVFFGIAARGDEIGATIIIFATTFIVGAGVAMVVALRTGPILRPLLTAAFPRHQLMTTKEELSQDPPGLSLHWRLVLTWMLTSGGPIIGCLLLLWAASVDLIPGPIAKVIPALIAVALVALIAGFSGIQLLARNIMDPLRELRAGIDAVRTQGIHPEIRIYDSSEIGLLQGDFNNMITGLSERQRIEDLFGRYVGIEVARAALEQQPTLGGQSRTVSVLFVDLIGSTTFAVSYPPQEVVATLNDFFERVVRIVHAHHGVINKFEGDAALAVFGAPLELADATTHALHAARELHAEIATMRLQAGIGVATGHVVAGHIGARERFEYTVIGDAVNTAARLTEIAKTIPDQVLTNATTLTQANEEERKQWTSLKAVELRGRNMLSQLARPLRSSLAESGQE